MAIPKSLSQEQFDVQHANEMEIATRELMRRSHDVIRVFNPLNQTFSFMYDRFWHRVPANSFKNLERYLAMKFYKNICDFMIGQTIAKKGQELIDLRIKQFGSAYKDKYEENVEVWDRTPKANDPQLLAEYFKLVIIGVVEEYGMEELENIAPVPETTTDYRPIHEQMFDGLTPVSASVSLPANLEEMKGIGIEAPLYVSKKDLEKEILNENKE